MGIGNTTVTMECQLWPETNQCVCTCNKLELLHIPCSHVYAARGKAGIEGTYVSLYYLKEAVLATWSGELRGWRALADFTKPPANGPDWIPDPDTKIIHRGRRKSRRIRNDMDASEARGGEKFAWHAAKLGIIVRSAKATRHIGFSGGTAERRVPQHTIKK